MSWGQQYNFKNYSVRQGLAQSQVKVIQQDSMGYLWVGTQSGLSRFDGITFTNYSVDNGLPDNHIEGICVDSSGNVWIGTPEGIAIFDGKKFKAYYFEETQRINDLEIFKGKLHIATNDGLVIFNQKQFEFIETGEESLYIRSLKNYKNEVLYCGTKTGLYSYNDSFTPFSNEFIAQLNVSGIEIKDEHLFVSTYGDGLFRYHLTNDDYFKYDLELKRIRHLFLKDNKVMCSTLNGAIEIEGNQATYFDEKNGLASSRLICSFIDSEGNYWFGSDGNGIFKFLGKTIISYGTADGLSSKLVMNINEDQDGNFLFGTYDEGLTVEKEDKEFQYFGKRELRNNSVWSTYIDANNTYWLATTKGLDCIKNGTTVTNNATLNINTKIRSIIGYKNKIICGGTEGVYIYDLDSDQTLFVDNTLDMNVNDLCVENDELFIASRTGLFVLNLTNYNELRQIQIDEETVNAVACDEENNLWIGTDNGLYVQLIEGPIIPIILDQSDFKSKTTFGIEISRTKDVWVSTMNGVYQLTKIPNARNKIAISHYGSAEGLIDLEGNLNAIYEDKAGMIWVGTSNGLAKIDPSLKEELFNFKAPKLRITGLRLFMEPFDYDRFGAEYENNSDFPSSITLPYNQNHLTFDFIGINLKDPESVMYEYRLSGANFGWSPLDPDNSATYSAISPGEYDFEVRATNKNFVWSDTVSISVTIRSPFWKTWWFIILASSLSAFIIILIFQARIRTIKQKQENEKLGYKNRLLFLEQQSLNASMNRHFIFNSLNSIQYFINSSDKRSANKYLSSFAKLIRKNLDSSTANNFIVTLQEEIDRIELYLTLEKMRFQDKFEYQLEVSSSIDTEGIEIPSMILQPFVENAIIHGVLPLDRKGNIQVKIYEEYGNIVFEVIDDGVGIDNTLANKKESIEGDHESKGMEITNRRIELLRKLTGDHLLIVGPFQLNDGEGSSLGTKVIIKMEIKSHLEE